MILLTAMPFVGMDASSCLDLSQSLMTHPPLLCGGIGRDCQQPETIECRNGISIDYMQHNQFRLGRAGHIQGGLEGFVRTG
jgi:hypothetical protein